ncbi:MAG: hypothetical protein GC201_05360 [Alphaproteobacteria bacterium]|nr:hypothetical protein [Alphaproteobacteria bacterium]
MLDRVWASAYGAPAFGVPSRGARKEGCLDERDRPSTSDIKARIDKARQKGSGADNDEANAKAAGLRVGIELLAGVAFGVVVGVFLDRWLGTAPWLLIVFMLLGMGAGIRNVIRAAQEENRKARDQD